MKPLEASVAKFPDLNQVIERLGAISFKLEQDTEDTAQLNPVERLRSIAKVWQTCKDKIGNPTTAIDVGSGFGYGVVFLEGHNIKTIGIENISKKIKQGQDLFRLVGINIPTATKLDFKRHPGFYEGDVAHVSTDAQADLITVFYLSLEMVSRSETFQTLQKLLKKDGIVLLSTEASVQEVQAFLENSPIPISFTYEIVEIPDNFEKTAILLKFK